MMMRLQKYNIDVHYADLLSRAYLPEVGREDDKEFELVNMIKLLPVSEQKLADIQKETEADQTLQVVKSMILKGWPNDKKELPLQAAPYYSMRDELTFQDGIILRGERLDQIGRSCTSVITIITFIQLVFMGSSYSTGIGITINRRKMVKLEIVQLPK